MMIARDLAKIEDTFNRKIKKYKFDELVYRVGICSFVCLKLMYIVDICCINKDADANKFSKLKTVLFIFKVR